MTGVGFVWNERCQELERLVHLAEPSDDPHCILLVRDLITEGLKRGIGVRPKLTQLEVLGEVYLQYMITCHENERTVDCPTNEDKKEKGKA